MTLFQKHTEALLKEHPELAGEELRINAVSLALQEFLSSKEAGFTDEVFPKDLMFAMANTFVQFSFEHVNTAHLQTLSEELNFKVGIVRKILSETLQSIVVQEASTKMQAMQEKRATQAAEH